MPHVVYHTRIPASAKREYSRPTSHKIIFEAFQTMWMPQKYFWNATY